MKRKWLAIGLVLLAPVLLVSCRAQTYPGAGRTVDSLAWNPGGTLLAATDTAAATVPRSGYRLAVLTAAGGSRLERAVVSRGAGWLAKPERVVYAVSQPGGICLVSEAVATGVVTRSAAIPGTGTGAIAAKGQAVACLVRGHGRVDTLYLWQPGDRRLRHWPLPAGFRPAFELPPAWGAGDRLLALVSEDGRYFVTLDLARGRWQQPNTSSPPRWDRPPLWAWQEVHPGGELGLWRSTDYMWNIPPYGGHDCFLVADQGRGLWWLNSRPPFYFDFPVGPKFEWPPPRPGDELHPLDVAARAVAYRGGKPLGGFRVWGEDMEGFSGDFSQTTVALVYRSKRGLDCVVYMPKGWRLIVGDGTLSVPVAALSPNGDRVALIRRGRLTVLKTSGPEGR